MLWSSTCLRHRGHEALVLEADACGACSVAVAQLSSAAGPPKDLAAAHWCLLCSVAGFLGCSVAEPVTKESVLRVVFIAES